MEPTEAINGIEASLRALINVVLGQSWPEKGSIDVESLKQRRTEEAKRREGAAVESDLLAYTHIYELRKIITKNWETFKPALSDRKRFDVFMDRIEDFRNVPMHSRELLPFERDLLSGISGELRNMVTIYRSQQGPDMNHYPAVDSLTDSFGNEHKNDSIANLTGLRLQVGHVVEFRCRGWDAQSRELTWTLQADQGPYTVLDTAIGDTVTLRWTVAESDVAENSAVRIKMTSSGKYHRMGSWDFSAKFFYAVDPPNES
ncbi:hypothetical protein [Streptomyces hydrogenans]|uniref:hypothetical protein n=1 Tax=Streptomyces hydrogenans TaxID=1873719 RepID=UPI0038297811